MNDDDWDYEYEEETLDAEEEAVNEIELPEIVRNFEKVCLSYSRYNNIPAMIGYYSILGDLVKHMVEIPYGPTTIDTRVHTCWIQTARSGKTTLLKYVLIPLMEEIYNELEEDEHITGNVLKLADYTTAALVGSHRENKDYIDDEDRINRVFEDRMNTIQNLINSGDLVGEEMLKATAEATAKRDNAKEAWIIEFGPVHGEGLWFADEFENSGVFEKRSHKEGMAVVFQHIMNNFHIKANVYEKILTGKPTIPLDSKFTIIAATYVPEFLQKTIATKGLLQRFLPFIWDVPDDIITNMRKDVINKFGEISENRGPPLFLKDGIITAYRLLKERYYEMGEDKLKTVVYHPQAKDVMNMEHDNLLRYIDNVNPKIRKIIRLFEMNLVEYMAKLAVLNAISTAKSIENRNERFIVYPQNVRQASYIIRKCYMALVSWLENAIKADNTSLLQKSKWKDFQQAYINCLEKAKSHQKREGGYIHKTLFLKEVEEVCGQSHQTVYDKFNEISEMFETTKIGKSTYLRPKETGDKKK